MLFYIVCFRERDKEMNLQPNTSTYEGKLESTYFLLFTSNYFVPIFRKFAIALLCIKYSKLLLLIGL